jgi:hypothetical protein
LRPDLVWIRRAGSGGPPGKIILCMARPAWLSQRKKNLSWLDGFMGHRGFVGTRRGRNWQHRGRQPARSKRCPK